MRIIHRKGTAHRNVDALTRDPTFSTEDDSEAPIFEEEIPTPSYNTHLNAFTVNGEEDSEVPHALMDSNLLEPPSLAVTPLPATQDIPPDLPQASQQVAWRLSDLQPLRIYIDGNIGSGKTTVIDHLKTHLPPEEWCVIPEPSSAWQPLLGPFYQAPEDSPLKPSAAALLQIAVLMAYAQEVPDFHIAPRIAMERGPWSSLEVFLKAQHLPTHLERLVHDVADCMWPFLGVAQPDSIIYLACPPHLCLKRIKQRQREEETAVNLEYLQLLEEHYERALQTFKGQVIRIDATLPPDEVAKTSAQGCVILVQTLCRNFNH
jgi:thymidylate kinase